MHQGHRFCIGAYRTFPVASLYLQANEPPLDDIIPYNDILKVTWTILLFIAFFIRNDKNKK
jgi:hypothetical protein